MAIVTVGAAECIVSCNPKDILVAHAIGSCIAVLLYDPIGRVAGLLHFMLPESCLDPAKSTVYPAMFADAGIAHLLHRATSLGAVTSRMIFIAAGGASMLQENEPFNVGQRNHLALTNIFRDTGLQLHKQDIGGSISRTIRVDIARGRVRIRKSASYSGDFVIDLGQLPGDVAPRRNRQ
jgi:chemotaxis protein CheD